MGLALSFPFEVFGSISHYESYKYAIVKDFGSWSLRRYAPAVAVETGGGRDNDSFMRLASYIGVFSTPANAGRTAVSMTTPVVSEAVAMTTPVVSSGLGGQGSTMRFILPSKYGRIEDAPVPSDPEVRLAAVPEKTMAAIQFSGRCEGSGDAVAKYEELMHLMQGSGWVASGQWELHRFNPPYTLAPFRTNEVLIPVEERGGAAAQ
mmetsp:Transcript_78866/g.174607  ORF Transcript_78866/g.174607 Transcript_78866/m.174607 type:complete len:206 (+) Transcript_78866:88-705(+)